MAVLQMLSRRWVVAFLAHGDRSNDTTRGGVKLPWDKRAGVASCDQATIKPYLVIYCLIAYFPADAHGLRCFSPSEWHVCVQFSRQYSVMG